MEPYVLTSQISGPRWARMQSCIEAFCFSVGLSLQIKTVKGLIRETVFFSAEGAEPEIQKLQRYLKRNFTS